MKTRSTLIFALLIPLLSTPLTVNAAETTGHHLGILLMAGARYDDMRMCVGSKAGVKGGPIADVMLTTRTPLGSNMQIGINLPVMRPILFGLAFKMLQFEPELQANFTKPISNQLSLVTGPSLGISLHYGPDYTSDRKNRSPSFFAAGPIVALHTGMQFTTAAEAAESYIGIKPFLAALLSRNHGTGTVLGGAVEYRRTW